MKILIGCPTSDHKKYCLQEYAAAAKKLLNDSTDILLVDNSQTDGYKKEIEAAGLPVIKGPWSESARDRIVASRNLLREHAIEKGYDYLFSLEQDVIPEEDALQKLLAHKKEIVSGVVMNNLPVGNEIKQMPMAYVVHPHDPTGLWYIDDAELQKPQLIEIKACALGCVLIQKSVLEKITFRYTGGFDDMMFCKDAIEAGFKIYLDTTVKPKHLHGSWSGIKK